MTDRTLLRLTILAEIQAVVVRVAVNDAKTVQQDTVTVDRWVGIDLSLCQESLISAAITGSSY